MQIFRTTAHPDRRNLTVALNMTETIRESESLETPDGSDSITSLLESKEEDTPVVSGLAQNKGSAHAQNKGRLALEFDKRERRKTEEDTHSAEIVDNPELAMDSQQSGPLLDLTDKGVVLDTQVDPRQASDGNPGILADSINADRSPMVDMQDITQKNARRRLETRTVAEMTNQLANQDTRPLADPTQLLRQFESIMMNCTQDANKQFDVHQRAWMERMIQLQDTLDSKTEERVNHSIMRHEKRVLQSEATLTEWERMLTEREEELANKLIETEAKTQQLKDDFYKDIRRLEEVLEEHNDERVLAGE